jgi:hypothetical protein
VREAHWAMSHYYDLNDLLGYLPARGIRVGRGILKTRLKVMYSTDATVAPKVRVRSQDW